MSWGLTTSTLKKITNRSENTQSFTGIVKNAKMVTGLTKDHDRFNIVVRGHNTDVNQLAWCCDDLTQTNVQFCQAYNQILNCSLYLV